MTCILVFTCDDSATSDKELLRLASVSDKSLTGYLHDLGVKDFISPYYRDESARSSVSAFFTSLSGSSEIADIILANAEKNRIKPSLAFALAYEESRFTPRAINDNGDSVDRGLFQLNSKSFPKLGESEVYDPEINARYGLAHLRFCLDEGKNEVAALAMYNAGNGRVGRGATPRRTLDYVYRVLTYEKNISNLFEATVAKHLPMPTAVVALGEKNNKLD